MFPRFSVIQSIDLPCTVEELYDFHQNPENMRAILPPGQMLKGFQGDPIAREGAEISLDLRLFGFPMSWKIRWATADAPSRLVDETVEGPFRLFLHEHRFRPLPEGGSRLTDHLMYALPLPWLSWPISLTVVSWALEDMLRKRQERTLAYFQERAEKDDE